MSKELRFGELTDGSIDAPDATLTTDTDDNGLEIQAHNGDYVLVDASDNTILRWDADNTRWTFESNEVRGIATLIASTLGGNLNADSNDITGVGSFGSNEITNQNYVEPQTTASEGTSYDIDLGSANYHKVTMTGDVTFDITNADGSDTNSVVLHLVQDGTGSRTPSFTPTVVWDSGSAPSWSTSANAEDVVTLIHDQDGSQWLGFVGGLGMAAP